MLDFTAKPLIFKRLLKIVETYYYRRQVCAFAHPSVCLSAWNNSAPIGRILTKFDIWEIFKNAPGNLFIYLFIFEFNCLENSSLIKFEKNCGNSCVDISLLRKYLV
jgi:hypothetical protein